MSLTDQEITVFAAAEPMKTKVAFGAQHAPNLNIRQRQQSAIEGVEVVSVWLDELNIDDLSGIAIVNKNASPRFSVGQEVRVVLVAQHRDEQPDGSRVRCAWPDMAHRWVIEKIEGELLHLSARTEESLEAMLHEARHLNSKLSALLDRIAKVAK